MVGHWSLWALAGSAALFPTRSRAPPGGTGTSPLKRAVVARVLDQLPARGPAFVQRMRSPFELLPTVGGFDSHAGTLHPGYVALLAPYGGGRELCLTLDRAVPLTSNYHPEITPGRTTRSRKKTEKTTRSCGG